MKISIRKFYRFEHMHDKNKYVQYNTLHTYDDAYNHFITIVDDPENYICVNGDDEHDNH